MTIYEIPLTAEPQNFQITFVDASYNITMRWNPIAVCWVLDIADENQVPVLQGLAVVTGIDLFAPYQYLGFGGALVAQSDTNPDLVPTFENIGTTSHIYFVTA
jgi:hypothetical protein